MYTSSIAEPGRDDRHVLLAKRMGFDEHVAQTKFLKSTILLTGERQVLSRPEGRLMALTAMNLIVRFCPRIDIFMPGVPGLASELVDLGEEIDSSEEARYRVLGAAEELSEYKAVLSVGATLLPMQNITEITASGWLAGVSSTGPAPVLPEGCGPGAMAAAALGASQVFIRLLEPPNGAAKLSGPMVFSTYDLTVRTELSGYAPDPGPVIERIDLPPMLLGGCGAVGQAFMYCLINLPSVVGEVWAIDRDHISLTNLNRCMLAFQRHVQGPGPLMKTDLVAEAVRNTGLRVYPDCRPLHEALTDRSTYPIGHPTVVVCGVDNAEARQALQRLWPDLFLEGSTGDAQVQVLRWAYGHDRGCSLCYHSDVQFTAEPYHERMASHSGLSAERISFSLINPDAVVTDDDVLDAPQEKQAFLAERKGRALCSVLSEIERFSQSQDAPAEPSVSFTSFFAGVILAAEIVKYAANLPQQLDSQIMADTLFPISRREVVQLTPLPSCYCQKRRSSIDHYRKAVRDATPAQQAEALS